MTSFLHTQRKWNLLLVRLLDPFSKAQIRRAELLKDVQISRKYQRPSKHPFQRVIWKWKGHEKPCKSFKKANLFFLKRRSRQCFPKSLVTWRASPKKPWTKNEDRSKKQSSAEGSTTPYHPTLNSQLMPSKWGLLKTTSLISTPTQLYEKSLA